MGPELLSPQRFGFKDGRPTRHSDCYALGMVVYEVLSRRVPFYRDADLVVFGHVVEGKRPERPQGVERAWFTDDIWGVLERCWTRRPDSRPSVKEVLQYLEKASKSWTPAPPQMAASPQTTDFPARNSSDSSAEGSADGNEVSSPSRVGPSRPSLELPPEGNSDENYMFLSAEGFQVLHEALGHHDLEAYVKNPRGSDLEESVGIPDTVGGAGPLDGFWY